MPKNPNRKTSILEDTIIKIIVLQEEINRDIDKLVDLEAEIMRTIKRSRIRNFNRFLKKDISTLRLGEDCFGYELLDLIYL